MQLIYDSIIGLVIGLGLVTVIDIVGSIVSRQLNIKYGYFSLWSLFAYTYTAFFVADRTNKALLTMIVVMLVGLYDALAGWIISQKLKANYGYSEDMLEKVTAAHRI